MTRATPGDLYEAVASTKEPHHDTLYCPPDHADKLARGFSKGLAGVGRTSKIDRVAGLDLIEIPRLDRVVVCQKGEVFPLAEDWKND